MFTQVSLGLAQGVVFKQGEQSDVLIKTDSTTGTTFSSIESVTNVVVGGNFIVEDWRDNVLKAAQELKKSNKFESLTTPAANQTPSADMSKNLYGNLIKNFDLVDRNSLSNSLKSIFAACGKIDNF